MSPVKKDEQLFSSLQKSVNTIQTDPKLLQKTQSFMTSVSRLSHRTDILNNYLTNLTIHTCFLLQNPQAAIQITPPVSLYTPHRAYCKNRWTFMCC